MIQLELADILTPVSKTPVSTVEDNEKIQQISKKLDSNLHETIQTIKEREKTASPTETDSHTEEVHEEKKFQDLAARLDEQNKP